MEFYITYFYHIRNLSTDTLPISINSGEPSWYHNFQSRDTMFKDKRGVWNGGYIDEISSSNLESTDAHETCTDCGRVKLVGKDCPFAKSYRAKLDKLDFNKVYKKLLKVAEHFDCNKICFVVYEKPDVVCGERWVMKDWFADHGIQIEEFNPKKGWT